MSDTRLGEKVHYPCGFVEKGMPVPGFHGLLSEELTDSNGITLPAEYRYDVFPK